MLTANLFQKRPTHRHVSLQDIRTFHFRLAYAPLLPKPTKARSRNTKVKQTKKTDDTGSIIEKAARYGVMSTLV